MRKLLTLLLGLGVLSVTAAELPVQIDYPEGKARLRWDADAAGGDVEYRVYRDGRLLATLEPDFEFELEYHDGAFERDCVYRVAEVSKSTGKEQASSVELAAAVKPLLVLDHAEGFSFGNIFPVTGQAVEFSVKVANTGAVTAKDAGVRVLLPDGGLFYESAPFDLEAGQETEVKFSSSFARRGVYDLSFTVTGAPFTGGFTQKFRVDDRPFYIHWYGYVPDLQYVNLRQGNRADMGKFRRHGNLAGCAGGLDGLPADALLLNLCQLADQGVDALYLDEICGDIKPTDVVLEVLPQLRARYPELFIAIWNIHDDLSPRVAELVKSGVIDLVMLEIYIKPGEDVTRIDRAAESMRRLGVADKTIIGLLSNATWSGGAEDAVYIDSLLGQIRRVHRVYPESPGIAFWDAVTPPGMQKAAEELILELYFNPVMF